MRSAFGLSLGILAILLLIFQIAGADFAEAQRKGGTFGNRWLSTPPVNKMLNRYTVTQNKFIERRNQILTNRAQFQKQGAQGTRFSAFTSSSAQKILPPASAFKQTKSLKASPFKRPLATDKLAALRKKLQADLSRVNPPDLKAVPVAISIREAKKKRLLEGTNLTRAAVQIDSERLARLQNFYRNKEAHRTIVEGKRISVFTSRGYNLGDVRRWVRQGKIIGYTVDERGPSKTDDGQGRDDPATVYGESKSNYVIINNRTGEVSQVINREMAKRGEWSHDSRINFIDDID